MQAAVSTSSVLSIHCQVARFRMHACMHAWYCTFAFMYARFRAVSLQHETCLHSNMNANAAASVCWLVSDVLKERCSASTARQRFLNNAAAMPEEHTLDNTIQHHSFP